MQSTTSDSTRAKRKHLHFVEGTHAFISIDQSIVIKLNLTESDLFIEEVTEDGSILLRRQVK